MQNNVDFLFYRTRKKIEKVKFVEVNLKRAVITLLITVLFAKLSVCSVI